MKTARFFSLLALAGMMFVHLVVPTVALAQGQLKGVKTVLGDPRPSTSTTYTFTFSTATAATLKGFQFNFCEESSGGCTTPDGFTAVGAQFVAGSSSGIGTATNWNNTAAAAGWARIFYTTGHGFAAGDVVTIRLSTITNSQIAANCDGDSDTSSDTCYVQLETCTTTDCSTSNTDEGIGSFTVVAAVTLTARVDPTFTFVLAGTGATTTYNGITTSIATTATAINYGNMAAGTPKYGAHKLNVTTNTQSGYTVKVRALAPGQGAGVMEGVYTSNNIDSFVAAWGSPTTWTEPTGTVANTDTAWFGANTTDTDVSGWNSSPAGKFGTISTTDVIVMQSSTSDNGSTAIYVTYALEANVFQPADTYTGYIVYTATPTY